MSAGTGAAAASSSSMKKTPDIPAVSSPSGLIQGGLGGPQEELLIDGQEEVFSRTEVESGKVEHKSSAGGGRTDSDA